MDTNLIEKILSGNANVGEKGQFEIWLKESDQNQELYEKTKVIWERLDGVYTNSSFDKSAAKIKISSKIKAGNNPFRDIHPFLEHTPLINEDQINNKN